MLTEKYKPKRLEDVVGQQEAIKKILKWIQSWKPGDKALLIHGPVGVGKTTIIQALASERDMDFIELNASDYRSAKQIRESIGRSIHEQSLFRRGKVFLIDEVDTLAGNEDRGGVSEMVKLIKETKHPIVLTANNPWISKLRSLRSYCYMIEIKRPSLSIIERYLKGIAVKEHIKIEMAAIQEIAKRSNGDLRSAMTDLESLRHKKKITVDDVLELGYRERDVTAYDALNKIFRASSLADARHSINNVDKTPDELFWWIESNITREYERPQEAAAAFDALSAADVFRGWIRKTKNWRFLAYMIDLMTYGVAAARHKRRFKYVSYRYPTLIATLGRTKRMRREQQERLLELAQQLHCSTRKVRAEFLPYLKFF